MLNTNLINCKKSQKDNRHNQTQLITIDQNLSNTSDTISEKFYNKTFLHYAIINLILRIFSDVKNNYVIDVYFTTISNFAQIKCDLIDLITVSEYIDLFNEALKTNTTANTMTDTIININKSNIAFANFDLDISNMSNSNIEYETYVEISEPTTIQTYTIIKITSQTIFVGNLQSIFNKVYESVLSNLQMANTIPNTIPNTITDLMSNIDFIDTVHNRSHRDIFEYENPVLVYLKNMIDKQDDIGIICDDRKISHKEIYLRAKKFASEHLTGLNKNTVIPMFCEKNINAIIATISIFISGLAYLPMELNSACNVVNDVVNEINPPFIFTNNVKQTKNIGHFNYDIIDINIIDTYDLDINVMLDYQIEKNNIPNIDKYSVAYIINTSGSTGRPKSVVQHFGTIYDVTKSDNMYVKDNVKANMSNLSFDATILDIFTCTIYAKTLVLIKDISTLKGIEYADSIITTSSILNNIKHDILKYRNLKIISLAGEKINMSEQDYLLYKSNGILFNNYYGPTEAGISATIKVNITYNDIENQNLGIALPNNYVYVLDEYLNECPKNVIGEFYIGGDKLFLKYLFNVPSNILATKYGNLYKTGDYG